MSWGHAVNSQQDLDLCLAGGLDGFGVVEHIEADVMLDLAASVCYMSHPPTISKDLSLADFLNQIRVFNKTSHSGMQSVI